eukprot:TRINITY_DN11035_c0_g1_i1.p1 TRINITY_DN11035_c0_g1~~TRINITY_DN11035_c0_g1_i1.p1  ORF type:complete len:212 (+),score=38.27 TRINITY_DN11035_c0_g1_i1:58-693(+)
MLQPGDVVEIKGLKTRPELNGKKGTVVTKGEGGSETRWGIEIDESTKVKVKRENLMTAGEWLTTQRELWEAVDTDNLEKVKELLQQGGCPMSVNQMKRTSLHRAAALCDPSAMLPLLLSTRSADPNVADISGITPLHIAAASSLSATSILLSAQASQTPSHSSRTPLHHAALSPALTPRTRTNIYNTLVAAGGDETCKDEDGVSPAEIFHK